MTVLAFVLTHQGVLGVVLVSDTTGAEGEMC